MKINELLRPPRYITKKLAYLATIAEGDAPWVDSFGPEDRVFTVHRGAVPQGGTDSRSLYSMKRRMLSRPRK